LTILVVLLLAQTAYTNDFLPNLIEGL